MPPLADLPAAYLALERERDALQGVVLDLQRQLECKRPPGCLLDDELRQFAS
jgi:hypothetical protein